MCDYSLQSVKSRPAAVGDKLITHNFGTGSRGFASVDDCNTAVCLTPGTEVGFDRPVQAYQNNDPPSAHSVAIFRQINTDVLLRHHDCLELPDGKQILLTFMSEGQTATVLQLPAAPRNEQEAKEQARVPVAA